MGEMNSAAAQRGLAALEIRIGPMEGGPIAELFTAVATPELEQA